MDHSSGILVHPLLCDHAAARLRPHRALCRAIGRACRATGAAVDYERHVPHMYIWEEANQRHREAILDVVVTWPGATVLRSIDVTICCPLAERVHTAWKVPGAAAVTAERRKASRYGEEVLPLAFESFGRMGPRSLDVMDTLAREACLYSTARPSAATLVRRWRADLGLALFFTHADALLQARGAAPAIAGAASFPIGRMLRAAAAAGGEQSQGPFCA